MAYSILIVDDDADLTRTIQLSLGRDADFATSGVLSGIDALRAIRRSRPDILVLDVAMPGTDGFEVCSTVRSDPVYQDLPIIFLTAHGDLSDRIEGLRRGADDYLTKPFSIEELALRIRAVLRRGQLPAKRVADTSHLIRVGDITLDTKTFRVRVGDGEEVLLTPVEFDLMHHLMVNAGTVYSCERLLQEVWGYTHDSGSPYLVRMHIRNLRMKVEPLPAHPTLIRTVPRYGYTIDSA